MAHDERMLAVLNDPVLRPFLTAREELVRRRELERVMAAVAQPAIRRVLRQCRRGIAASGALDTDDIEASIVLRVLEKLESARQSEDDAVVKLDDYVARLTFNAVADLRRQSAPEWAKLKRRLRYVATADARLAAWEVPAGTLVGLTAWRDRIDARTSLQIEPAAVPLAMRDDERPGDALVALMQLANAPLPLDLVTTILAGLWRAEPGLRQLDDGFADDAPTPVAEYETREQLQIVWEEICALPLTQRAALLLNLRDAIGLNAAVLFPLTGVATFDAIAEAMEMHPEALAEIWARLPLSDLEIAETLAIGRQQVINLRKAARARLQRRIAHRQRGRGAR